jgi:hypothetical protein
VVTSDIDEFVQYPSSFSNNILGATIPLSVTLIMRQLGKEAVDLAEEISQFTKIKIEEMGREK